MSSLFFRLMKKMVQWLDPRLEKYRPTKEVVLYTPGDKKDLIELLARSPIEVLSKKERATIAGVMGISERKVKDIMLAKNEMTFVHENEFLGPLLLNELFKSGFEHFPVLGTSGRITGMIHMSDLNKIERLNGQDRVLKYLDESVYYLREDYNLERALTAFVRTNCHFFIVINAAENPVGLITFEILMEAVLGRKLIDNFEADLDIAKVAGRKLS